LGRAKSFQRRRKEKEEEHGPVTGIKLADAASHSGQLEDSTLTRKRDDDTHRVSSSTTTY
jgi:hypothetical protein